MQVNPRTLKIIGIAVAIVLVILIALPLFINVNSFRPKIEAELTTALGRPVTLGKLSLSILTGSLTVENVSIADDPAFSKSPFITAKSLKVGVELLPLIFSKQLNITGILLDQPQITLLKATNGTWNFSSLGGNAKKPAEPKTGTPQNLTIGKLEVRDGKLTVGKANSSSKAQVYNNVNATVRDLSFKSKFPFELAVDLPGSGKATLEGKAGPIHPQDTAKTPFEAAMKVEDMDIAASGFVDLASGIAGVASLDGTLNSNGSQANAVGTFGCEKVRLSPRGTPAPKAVNIKYNLNADLDREVGNITQGDIGIGKAAAKLTGGFQTQGDKQILNLKLNAPNMPVEELEAMLPALGVVLPSGSKLKGGTLSADLSITGPLDRTVVAGPIRLANTKLTGFDLGGKLAALSAFTGKTSSSSDTTIQNASLNARMAPEGTRADAINVNVPSIGVVTGSGTVSPAGALDFRMVAALQGSGGVLQQTALGSGNGIPFMIQGTTANPKFVPDVASMAGSAIQGVISGKTGSKTSNSPVSAIEGLLGRKKK